MHAKYQQNARFFGLPFLHWLTYRLTHALLVLIGKFIFRPIYKNAESFPEDGPYLLLPNHSSMLDPFWVGTPSWRPLRFMASAQLLAIPILGPYLTMLGSFPKKKYTKDRAAMATFQDLYEKGFGVTIFPEGRRTWNGRQSPVLPGIGRLIKRMNATVVFGRMNTAYFFQPRWSRYPRWVPIEITYDGPHTYPQDMSAEEITADVQRRLSTEIGVTSGRRVLGFRMAHGLSNLLWACPSCFAIDALDVDPADGNAVRCSRCQAHWRIDVETRLEGTTRTTVLEAADAIEAHFGSPPVADAQDFEVNGVALRAAQGEIRLTKKGQPSELLASGELVLSREGFSVRADGRQVWSVGFETMEAVSMEFGNRLHFRVEGVLHEVRPAQGSLLKWSHFLRQWQAQAG